MTFDPAAYKPRFNDLPESSEMTWICRKWIRARSWGTTGELRYARPEAIPVMLNEEQHRGLRGYLRDIAIQDRLLLDKVSARLKEGSPTGAIAWDARHTGATLSAISSDVVQKGFPKFSAYWFARVRAAATTLRKFKEQLTAGKPIGLDWTAGWSPAGVSVRLASGMAHGRPLEAAPQAGGAWVVVPDLGALWASSGLPEGYRFEDVHYVEFGHCERQWRMRCVFAYKNPNYVPKKWEKKVVTP